MNRTPNSAVSETPKIERTGEPHQLTMGPVQARKPRPAICEWADRLAEFDVDAACQGVALQLASYADRHGGCFPSVATLAKRVKLKERQCRTHLKTLERKGLIQTRQRGRGHTNTYKLNGYGWAYDRQCTAGLDRQYTAGEGNHRKVDGSELRASAPATPTVRTNSTGSKARPIKGAVEPLPEPSPEKQKDARKTLQAVTAAFKLSLMDGTAQELRTAHTEAVRAPATTLGCPACGHDRLMGGSCDQCGHDTGEPFQPSADWNIGG